MAPRPTFRPLAFAACIAAAATTVASASAAPPAHLVDEATASAKAPRALNETSNPSRYIDVKFSPAADVRVDGARVVGAEQGRSAVDAANTVLTGSDVASFVPLFSQSPEELRRMSDAVEDSATSVDLTGWHRVVVADGANPAEVTAQLRALSSVETAYVVPKPSGAPTAPVVAAPALTRPAQTRAGDFQGQQTYLEGENRSGVDALWAWDVPGGSGSNVTVTDVEYGWFQQHEDLTKLRNANITEGSTNTSWQDHGTAVAGEIWADRNGSGVTGIVHDSTAQLSSASSQAGWNPAGAIATAARRSSRGDVILLEQQTEGCGGGFAPVEVLPSVHEAIKAAVAKGIHVVEAAGNGSQNLDSSCYGGAEFPGGRGDSGAIIVGAGSSSTCSRGRERRPMSYTTYGTRVDLQGWGECVVTTGFGDLSRGGNNANYTKQFSGTSSASPIVTGVVASVSSIAEQRGIRVSPAEMRDLLVRTGLPQRSDRRKIGPLPNIRRAVAELDSGVAPTTTPVIPTTAPTSPVTSAPPVTSTTSAPVTTAPVNGFYENTTRQEIRDYRTASSAITSRTAGAEKVALGITMEHGCAEHLEIAVTTPDGTRNVVKRSGYAWRCSAWSGEKSETYPMRSETEGTWTLEVSDRQRGYEGELSRWSLRFS